MTGAERVLIVTGGARGIGAAIVRQAAGEGYAVCLNYARDAAAASALAGELRGRGARIHAVQGDVAEPGTAARLFDEAEAVLGPVTALVNNAGITGPIGPFRDTDAATLRRVLEVNVLGTMLCAQEAVRRWQDRGTPGTIVNISSTAAQLGSAGDYVHYAAGKAAVETFTIGLGREVAPLGIRVNAVSPGMTATEIHAAAGQPDRLSRVVSRIPMGRPGEPEEIAEGVLWLLSDRAGYVTASILRVAGGL